MEFYDELPIYEVDLPSLIKTVEGKSFEYAEDYNIETIAVNDTLDARMPKLIKIKGLRPLTVDELSYFYECLPMDRITMMNGTELYGGFGGEVPEPNLFEFTGYGNITDWVPIYTLNRPTSEELVQYLLTNSGKVADELFDGILDSADFDNLIEDVKKRKYDEDRHGMNIYYNINRSSKHYKTLSISSYDDHGRMGIYQITKFNTLEELKKNIEPFYYDMAMSAISDQGWGSYYTNSINLLMDDMDMMYHFG